MKLSWNRTKTCIVATTLLALVCAYTVVLFLGQPGRTITVVSSFTQRVEVWGPLHIEVSPMGYPIIGQSWTIRVYTVEIVSNRVTLSPSSNSTVVVAVKYEGSGRNYNFSVDPNGQISFSFLPEYTDVAFQAFSGKLSSEKLVISSRYVSSDSVNLLASVNLVSSAVTFGGAITLSNKKGKILKAAWLVVVLLFVIVSCFALYSRFFQETVWGYPENTFGGIITLTSLKYVTYIGFLLLFIVTVITFTLHLLRSTGDPRLESTSCLVSKP